MHAFHNCFWRDGRHLTQLAGLVRIPDSRNIGTVRSFDVGCRVSNHHGISRRGVERDEAVGDKVVAWLEVPSRHVRVAAYDLGDVGVVLALEVCANGVR